MQQNGMSENVKNLAIALAGVLNEVAIPLVEISAELDTKIDKAVDRLEKRIDTTNQNVQDQLMAQHKETTEQVRRIARKGY